MSEWDLPTSVESVSIENAGGGFVWDTGVYDVTVKLVYLDQASSGAVSFNVVLTNSNNQELREAMYIKSGKSKGNKTFYTKDGKDYPLPGYSTANSLCLAATGKSLSECMAQVEKKTVKVYDFTEKKEVSKERPVLMSLLNTTVKAAVKRIKENKQQKNNEGVYVPIADTREKNECSFFGNAQGFSAEEAASGATEATKLTEWAEKNAGNTVDKSRKDIQAGTAASDIMGGNSADASAAKTSKSLFG